MGLLALNPHRLSAGVPSSPQSIQWGLFFGSNLPPQDSDMEDNRPNLEILRLVLLDIMAVVAIARNVFAAPVKLPSGMVLDLTMEQVGAIKEQPGVFYGAQSTEMLFPRYVVVIPLPYELGAGYLYGGGSTWQRVLALWQQSSPPLHQSISL